MKPDSESRIVFRNFWRDFDPKDNYIINALRGQPIENHLLIASVFEKKASRLLRAAFGHTRLRLILSRESKGTVRRIWFTGENVRPPVSKKFDSYISFDQDSYGGINTYFPLFYLELLYGSKQTILRRGVDITEPEQLTQPRSLEHNQPKFVCAFLNNPEPTRLRAIDELRKHGEVEIFGSYVGRPVPSKYEIAREFKFCLAFENDLFPGYVTEKLLDAYLCGTIPLYWGDFGAEKHINRASFINARDFESLASFAAHVSGLGEAEYRQIYREPLLRGVPNPEPLLKALLGS